MQSLKTKVMINGFSSVFCNGALLRSFVKAVTGLECSFRKHFQPSFCQDLGNKVSLASCMNTSTLLQKTRNKARHISKLLGI